MNTVRHGADLDRSEESDIGTDGMSIVSSGTEAGTRNTPFTSDCILHVCTFMPPIARLQGPHRKAEEGQHGMNFLSKED